MIFANGEIGNTSELQRSDSDFIIFLIVIGIGLYFCLKDRIWNNNVPPISEEQFQNYLSQIDNAEWGRVIRINRDGISEERIVALKNRVRERWISIRLEFLDQYGNVCESFDHDFLGSREERRTTVLGPLNTFSYPQSENRNVFGEFLNLFRNSDNPYDYRRIV